VATPYFGSLAVVFLGLAVTGSKRRHRWWVRASLLLSGFVLLLALGRHTPIFSAYFETVPGARLFRYPAKFYGLLSATLPFVAAAGIDAWRTERRLNRRFLLGVSLLGAVLVIGLAASSPIATALASLRDSATETAALSTVRAALGIELGSVLLLSGGLLLVRKRAAHGLPLGIVLALGAQVVGQNFRAYETADGRVFSRPPELIERVVATTPSASVPRVKHTLPVMNVQGFDSLPGPVRAERLADSLTKNIAIAFGVGYAQA
jgi:hypothetical protein